MPIVKGYKGFWSFLIQISIISLKISPFFSFFVAYQMELEK